jgi:hypothetical protein
MREMMYYLDVVLSDIQRFKNSVVVLTLDRKAIARGGM